MAAQPGQVITSENVASLLAAVWPHAMTPLSNMSGLKKCAIHHYFEPWNDYGLAVSSL